MTLHRLSRTDARRGAVRARGGSTRPTGSPDRQLDATDQRDAEVLRVGAIHRSGTFATMTTAAVRRETRNPARTRESYSAGPGRAS